jgi:hypothetical protein
LTRRAPQADFLFHAVVTTEKFFENIPGEREYFYCFGRVASSFEKILSLSGLPAGSAGRALILAEGF